jgi:endonuclease YncB( thermonuclease family)
MKEKDAGYVEGDQIQIELIFPSGKVDRGVYGRLIPYVRFEGEDLGLAMIEAGQALAGDYDNPKMKQYQLAQGAARRQHVGMSKR